MMACSDSLSPASEEGLLEVSRSGYYAEAMIVKRFETGRWSRLGMNLEHLLSLTVKVGFQPPQTLDIKSVCFSYPRNSLKELVPLGVLCKISFFIPRVV